eukprot:Ihof_evm1s253 gene=Ihof_evmTU1s253
MAHIFSLARRGLSSMIIPLTASRLSSIPFNTGLMKGYRYASTENTNNKNNKNNNDPEEVCENLLKSITSTKYVGPSAKQRRTFVALVQNEPGVLSKLSGMISARGFNIDSLVVGRTNVPDLSRMTLVFYDTTHASEQLRAQLEDMVPVWAVVDYTDMSMVERELLLIKVSLDKENNDLPKRMRRDLNRRSLTELTALFEGKVQDVGMDAIIIELAARPARVITFMSLLHPYYILEASRT